MGIRAFIYWLTRTLILQLLLYLRNTSPELVGIRPVKQLFYKFGLPDILCFDKVSYSITEMLNRTILKRED